MEEKIKRAKTGLLSRVLILVVLGVLDSLYLVYHHVELASGFQRGTSFCNLGGMINCDKVAQSPYAELFGIPVASLGAFYYVVFLLLVFLLWTRSRSAELEQAAADTCLFFSLLALPSTLFFLYVSLVEVQYICISCSFLYLVNFALIFVAWRDPFRSKGFIAAVVNGARYLWQGLVLGKGQVSFALRIVFWSAAMLALLLLALAPYLLVTQVFVPREALLSDKDYLGVFYDKWKQGKEFNIPVQEHASPLEKDFSYGSPEAATVIVEFSDFQCPFCRSAAAKLKEYIDSSGGQVRLVFKQYPLDRACNPAIETDYHLYACQAALLVRCAGLFGDDFFWEMHDKLFSLASNEWNLDRLLSLPNELGLENEKVDACLSDPRVMARVKEDILVGKNARVPGTPSLFLNGKRLQFDSLESLPNVIDFIARKEASSQASNN